MILSSILAITASLLVIILVAFIAYLFCKLYRMLRKARGVDKPMFRLFLWLSAFTGFFVFMQVFMLIEWLQTFGYIATPLSLEGFGVAGSLIHLVLALLIIPVLTTSRRILEGLNLVKKLSGELNLIHMSPSILRSIRGRLSAMFSDKSSSNILYALGKEEGSSTVRAFKGVKEGKLPAMDPLLAAKLLEAKGLIEKGMLEGDKAGREFDFTIYGSVEAEGIRGDAPTCYFISGWLAGALEGLTGLQASAVEGECAAKGDPHCRIHIRLSTPPLRGLRRGGRWARAR